MATYHLMMASRTKKGRTRKMAKYMIVYVNTDGDTMAQFGDTIAKLKDIEDYLFRNGIKLVQWYMLNEHNEYVCLSITVMHR